MTKQKTFN